jgi:hypothetical protein
MNQKSKISPYKYDLAWSGESPKRKDFASPTEYQNRTSNLFGGLNIFMLMPVRIRLKMSQKILLFKRLSLREVMPTPVV